MTLVQDLIDKAAKNLGSQAALARELGVHRAQITNWKRGTHVCKPDDLAAIGYFAGYNALNILAAATIKETEGTAKGKVLEAALGKEIPALGCLNASGSTTQNAGNDREIQCILCLIDKTGVCTRRSSDSNTPVFEPLRTA
ncbi:YdaS family helix-turn-helix protein [Comamonas aquatica]|uniref:YdaS family helix-turn-helix protein n=1 Tax=Comamonas aquatica TaxID=225991 RepID=UPI003C7B762F